ncbi:hypothetical protein RDWZM_007291 [Blomia tropicalis]|uniref:mRNA export factor GLE1 n=1 Tax=Blomia tropicalis TaxID=40697 RepID=A0A9Q0LZ66_BLOTA|nr:Nuclear pore complex nucleoporin component [Blomia tropicalis]KAJ6216134.1 hypothetical protein RDWZM_007291 [Blomia tropicalis]
MTSVTDALRQTPKGKLSYDTKWREEGRTEEIVNSIKQSVSSIRLTPKSNPTSFKDSNSPKGSSFQKLPDLCDTNTGINFLIENDKADAFGDSQLKRDNKRLSISNQKKTDNISVPLIDYGHHEFDLIKYEKEQNLIMQQKMYNITNQFKQKKELLIETVNAEMNLIHKKYLLLNIQNDRQYEEECEQLKQLCSSPGDITEVKKNAHIRLKEFEEKQKRLEKQREMKRIEQQHFRQSLINSKDSIGKVIIECNQRKQQWSIKTSNESVASSNVANELGHYINLLSGLVQDLDVILLTKPELELKYIEFGDATVQESLRLKQKFFDLIQKQETIEKKPLQTGSNATLSNPIVFETEMKKDGNINNAKITSQSQMHSTPIKAFSGDSFSGPKDIYIQHQLFLLKFEEKCKLFVEKCDKKRRMNLQMTIRSTINTVCNNESSDLRSKTTKMLNLFGGKFSNVSCTEDDDSLSFAINDAVKQFINVSIKQKNMSLQLAPVIAILWWKIPLFGKVFQAHLFRSCPYTIPYYPTISEGQTDSEFMVTCGYQLNSDGTISENEEFFHDRMYAMIQLYAAILQCNINQQHHPHDLHNAWVWLARVLTTQPKVKITALMLDSFLSITGHKLLRVYGRQFVKLIHFISKQYYSKMESITPTIERQSLMKFKTVLTNIEDKMIRPNGWHLISQTLSIVPDSYFQSFLNDRQ